MRTTILEASLKVATIVTKFFQKAEAQLAYELQAAKIQQRIRNEEIQIQVQASNDDRSSL
jgi:hypothetical protein